MTPRGDEIGAGAGGAAAAAIGVVGLLHRKRKYLESGIGMIEQNIPCGVLSFSYEVLLR